MDDTARLTETVSKAVAISGASAEAADAALVQFGQALASGTLRGEELEFCNGANTSFSKSYC